MQSDSPEQNRVNGLYWCYCSENHPPLLKPNNRFDFREKIEMENAS
jgi:hypothetical protein